MVGLRAKAGVWGAASPPGTGAKPGVPGTLAKGVGGTRAPGFGVAGAASPPGTGTKDGVPGVSFGVTGMLSGVRTAGESPAGDWARKLCGCSLIGVAGVI